MEEKNVTKISLSTLLLLLSLIIIAIMGVIIFKLNNDKTSEIQKSTNLQSQVTNLNNTVNDLQGKIDKISETINDNNSNEDLSETENSTTNENSTKSENTNNSNNNSTQNNTLEEANVTDTVNKNGLIGRATYQIIKSADTHFDGFDVKLENSKVYFELTDKEKFQNLIFPDAIIKRTENEKEEITGFNGKVKKVYYYQVGQGISTDAFAILFLMEDGKIEYISLYDAIQTNNLSSRGEIDGLNNITEIYSADLCEWVDENGGPSSATCVAKDYNDNYYSLEIAFEKNNIDLGKVK